MPISSECLFTASSRRPRRTQAHPHPWFVVAYVFGTCISDHSSQGYKPGAAKSADEYAQLDAEDESLARWKASLGIVPGSAAPATGPKVGFKRALFIEYINLTVIQ